MKIIKRVFKDGKEVLSEPIPANSLRNVWAGDTCTVYEKGDELPPSLIHQKPEVDEE